MLQKYDLNLSQRNHRFTQTGQDIDEHAIIAVVSATPDTLARDGSHASPATSLPPREAAGAGSGRVVLPGGGGHPPHSLFHKPSRRSRHLSMTCRSKK
ncbi:hypothetical protein GCM10010469_17610 [Streptomyces labedae]|uniref:Uncharacterized protein n=1 Tax=Streptomyces labedae TaxID=285569 RepID=A0ABP6QVF5_9ACTN